jgi:hypothetical protein
MRRIVIVMAMAALTFGVPAASAAVEQTRDSTHHEIKTFHDLNICGDPGTFTFEVTSHTHTVTVRAKFFFTEVEAFRYSLVFDDPNLGSWSAHGTETTHFAALKGQSILFHDNLNSQEGPVQIIEHRQFHTDAAGNVAIDRIYERHVGC